MSNDLFARYQELQRYVGWTEDDGRRIAAVAAQVESHFPELIADFYAEISRHAETQKVIVGGDAQIERLKRSLAKWLRELFAGSYDAEYVAARWRVGLRHVEIGLDQVFTNAALSRLRHALGEIIDQCLRNDVPRLLATRRALNLLIDLDLAIIEDAYQSAYHARQRELALMAETRRVRQAVQQSEAALYAVLESVPCMIVILNPRGMVRYFSPYAESLTGYKAADVMGLDYFLIFLPEESVRQAVVGKVEGLLGGQSAMGFENPIQCRDGSTRWMVWNAQRLDDYRGETVVLAVGQDITSLKQAQQRALQAERLAAIGQMMTGLAHESRNALQRSQACLEMLALDLRDRPVALDLVSRIQKAQDHLHQLYEEVRDYAAPIRLKIEDRDLRAILQQTWENLTLQRAGREARLVLNGSDQCPGQCAVDALAIEQVFRNILDNSLSACADPVEIETQWRDSTLEDKPAVEIRFSDNGPGLTAEVREKLFEPFFTTKTRGTGLGMAIAKRMVEAHGGQIGIVADHRPGAHLVMTLPCEFRGNSP